MAQSFSPLLWNLHLSTWVCVFHRVSSSSLMCLTTKEEHRYIKKFIYFCIEKTAVNWGQLLLVHLWTLVVIWEMSSVEISHTTVTLAQNMKIISTRTLQKNGVHLQKNGVHIQENGVPISFSSIFESLDKLDSFGEALILWKHTGLLNTQVLLSKIPYI